MVLKDDRFARANLCRHSNGFKRSIFHVYGFIMVLFKRGSYMYWQHAPSPKCLTSHLSLPWALRQKTRRPRPKIRNVSPKNCSRHVATPIRSRQCFVGRGLKKDGDGWTTKLRKVDQHTCILAYIESYTLPCLALHYLTLLYITLPYITFPYPTLHYLALHYLTLHYITLPDIKYYIYYITLALHHIKK